MSTFNGSGINSSKVLVDPTGLTRITGTDLQTVLEELDSTTTGAERTLLHRLQFEASSVGSILPATVFYFDPTLTTTNPSDGDTLVLNDGFNPAETFTFRTVPSLAFDVGIDSDVRITMTNLATGIETDSVRFRAVKVTDLTRLHSSAACRGHAVIIVCKISRAPAVPRIYGTFAASASSRPRVPSSTSTGFTSTKLRYSVDSTLGSTPPSGDPGVDQSFGYDQQGNTLLFSGALRVTVSEPTIYIRQVRSPTSGINWIPVGPSVETYTSPVAVSPGNTVNNLFWVPRNVTLVGFKVYAETTPTTAGNFTLAVDAGGSNILASTPFDLTSLSAATLTSIPLTLTTSLLDRATGSRIRFQFVSDNGDLVATGVYVQLLYRSRTL